MEINYELILGGWGTILSTILGIREIQKSKINLDITYSFTSSDEIGNTIFIYNRSDTPVTINILKLEFFEKIRFGWRLKRAEIFPDDEELLSIRIEPHSQYDMNFSEQNHFNWGKQKIRIVLYIAGRKKFFSKTLYKPEF